MLQSCWHTIKMLLSIIQPVPGVLDMGGCLLSQASLAVCTMTLTQVTMLYCFTEPALQAGSG